MNSENMLSAYCKSLKLPYGGTNVKRILSLSLAVALLLSAALFTVGCGDQNSTTASCYICHKVYEKSQMDSGELLDEIVYICYDCLDGLKQPEDGAGDDHDHGHDHSH